MEESGPSSPLLLNSETEEEEGEPMDGAMRVEMREVAIETQVNFLHFERASSEPI